MSEKFRIGVSCRLGKPQRDLAGKLSKETNTVDRQLVNWLSSNNFLPIPIPSMYKSNHCLQPQINVDDYTELCHGLVLQGGLDVSPTLYGEKPIDDAWSGDLVEDEYELELIHSFKKANKPIFGICRGLQIINVYHGGSLYQDIPSQLKLKPHATIESTNHIHDIRIEDNSIFRKYISINKTAVVSSHHQAIKNLGRNLIQQAYSDDDNLIEAICDDDLTVIGVQWHPEYHCTHKNKLLMPSSPLMNMFKEAIIRYNK